MTRWSGHLFFAHFRSFRLYFALRQSSLTFFFFFCISSVFYYHRIACILSGCVAHEMALHLSDTVTSLCTKKKKKKHDQCIHVEVMYVCNNEIRSIPVNAEAKKPIAFYRCQNQRGNFIFFLASSADLCCCSMHWIWSWYDIDRFQITSTINEDKTDQISPWTQKTSQNFIDALHWNFTSSSVELTNKYFMKKKKKKEWK